MPEIKFPSKELILCAFLGGTAMSLLELMNMFVERENVLDPYFYGGMLIAGLIGIFGLLLSQAKDIGGAITAGIAAPQVLGGLTKVAPTVAALLTAPIGTAYAEDIFQMPDSLEITTIVVGEHRLIEIKPLNSRKGLLLRDTTYIKVPAGDTLEIVGDQYEAIRFCLKKSNKDREITIRIRVKKEKITHKQLNEPAFDRLLRGMFGNSHRKGKKHFQRLELSIEEKEKD